ncbi:MAG: glycosyltransferase, partial [Spirochaetota bacterium]
ESSHEQSVILLISTMEQNYSPAGDIIALCPLGNGAAGKAFAVLRRIILMRRIAREKEFDALIGFGAAANIVTLFAGTRAVKIITEHNIKSQENRSWGLAGRFYDAMMKCLYNRADHVVAISSPMKEDLEKHYGIRNVVRIFNPHNTKEIMRRGGEALPSDFGFLADTKYIIGVGPTDDRKGFFHLVRSFNLMKEKIPDLRCVLLGNKGELHDAILSEAHRLGISDDIILPGYMKNPYPFMAHAALFALSSRREGLPNVLIESLALGVPAVSVDCLSGPREILGGQCASDDIAEAERVDCGALVPVFVRCSPGDALSRDERIFAEEACALLTDEKRYARAKARCFERAEDFSAERIMARYAALLGKE